MNITQNNCLLSNNSFFLLESEKKIAFFHNAKNIITLNWHSNTGFVDYRGARHSPTHSCSAPSANSHHFNFLFTQMKEFSWAKHALNVKNKQSLPGRRLSVPKKTQWYKETCRLILGGPITPQPNHSPSTSSPTQEEVYPLLYLFAIKWHLGRCYCRQRSPVSFLNGKLLNLCK